MTTRPVAGPPGEYRALPRSQQSSAPQVLQVEFYLCQRLEASDQFFQFSLAARVLCPARSRFVTRASLTVN